MRTTKLMELKPIKNIQTMNKIVKEQILRSCNDPSISLDKLDEYVERGDISIEELKKYNLELSKVKELERRQKQREEGEEYFDLEEEENDGLDLFEDIEEPVATPTKKETKKLNKAEELQKAVRGEVIVDEIVENIKNRLYTYEDLKKVGISAELINSFKHFQNQKAVAYTTVDSLPPMERGRTDVFFVGIAASGKSVMLSGLLYYANKVGIRRLDGGNNEGDKYAAQIITDLKKSILPRSTTSGLYNYIATSLSDDKDRPHPFNIVEIPGENYKKIYEGDIENEEVKGFVNYIKNENRKILIFVLDVLGHEQILDADLTDINSIDQDSVFGTVLSVFKNNRILEKTDAVYIVVNKFDLIKKKNPNTTKTDLELADEFVKTEFTNLLNSCIAARNTCSNKFNIRVLPYSIGKIVYGKILKEFHPEYSERLVKQLLSDSFVVAGGKKGLFSLFR